MGGKLTSKTSSLIIMEYSINFNYQNMKYVHYSKRFVLNFLSKFTRLLAALTQQILLFHLICFIIFLCYHGNI
jgi:hypothetical protein